MSRPDRPSPSRMRFRHFFAAPKPDDPAKSKPELCPAFAMFLCQVPFMEQQSPDKPVDEDALNAAMRGASRKPVGLQIAGWCLVVTCALTIGTILVSDPKVTRKFSALVDHLPAAAPIEAQELSEDHPRNAEFSADGSVLAVPARALLAFGSMSQSARSALGFDSPADHVDLPPLPEAELAETDELSKGGFGSSFFGSSRSSRPTVSTMPESRVPVHRAGISSGN